jgi:hypothetical protein
MAPLRAAPRTKPRGHTFDRSARAKRRLGPPIEFYSDSRLGRAQSQRPGHPKVNVKVRSPILPVPLPWVPVETKLNGPLCPFKHVNVPLPVRGVT